MLCAGISLIEISYQWDFEKATIVSLIKQKLPHLVLQLEQSK